MCGRLEAARAALTRVLRRSCEDGRYTLRALARIEEGSEVLISYRAQMSNRICQVSSFSPPPPIPTHLLPPSSLAHIAQSSVWTASGCCVKGAAG